MLFKNGMPFDTHARVYCKTLIFLLPTPIIITRLIIGVGRRNKNVKLSVSLHEDKKTE